MLARFKYNTLLETVYNSCTCLAACPMLAMYIFCRFTSEVSHSRSKSVRSAEALCFISTDIPMKTIISSQIACTKEIVTSDFMKPTSERRGRSFESWCCCMCKCEHRTWPRFTMTIMLCISVSKAIILGNAPIVSRFQKMHEPKNDNICWLHQSFNSSVGCFLVIP